MVEKYVCERLIFVRANWISQKFGMFHMRLTLNELRDWNRNSETFYTVAKAEFLVLLAFSRLA